MSIYTTESTKHFLISEYDTWSAKIVAGDEVFLTGTVYTARDAAHKRIKELAEASRPLPFDPKGAFIYYAGPTESRPGKIIGSCGPTTSSRMDQFTPLMLSLGISGIIGKGERSIETKKSFLNNNALYFCAIGGCGALYSECITSCEIIAFDDLGCESVKKLHVKDFPVYCAYDLHGGDIFKR
ncbi:MAG: FumA C-terminus/TtdB family hydratase beta subunit [Oscillospiraceae bacterium]|nr:FumA C-terminus/TtdB family hydratase beta subunit [Oscillospiraceae bacterium]